MAGTGVLTSSGGRLVYAGGDNPARRMSLRSAPAETVLIADEERELANGVMLHWGRVRTTDSVTFYKKVRVADDREVGIYPLDLPDVILETQAFWVSLPPLPRGARPSFESFGGALHAGEHGMIGLLPLF